MERIRGSIDLPLSRKGEHEVWELAQKIAEAGGFDRLFSSPRSRAVETANVIAANHIKTRNEGPRAGLRDWSLGALEGQPVKKALPLIKWLVEHPDAPAPGMGGTERGESFNTASNRALDAFKELRSESYAHPDQAIGAVTHTRVINLVENFLEPNPTSSQLNPKLLVQEGTEPISDPADVYRVEDEGLSKWTGGTLGPGLYLVRHGSTDFNG